jgi:hypothetical protein
MTFRNAFTIFGREQVDSTFSGNAENGSIAGENVNATTRRDDVVVTA